MKKQYDAVVIGGGVIGCSIAGNLAERGYRVAIVERAHVAAEASQAAAGLLGVQAEWDEYDPLFELARQSRALFPRLAEQLRERTGIDIGYEEKGIYRVTRTEEGLARLQDIMTWQQRTGEESILLSPEELREREPGTSPAILGALFCPKDGHVLAPELTQALAYAAAAAGADIYEGTEVHDLHIQGNQVAGVNTAAGVISCEQVVIAAGAWSTRFLQSFSGDWETYPVKGVMLSVQSYQPLLQAPLFEDGFYIVPKRHGRYLIGATKEEGVYHKTVPAGDVHKLLERAAALLPATHGAQWSAAWAGLRPQSRHEMPYMGAHPHIRGLYACTGHYRNGILLSPIAGRYMADVMEGKQTGSLLDSLLQGREPLATQGEWQSC